jgi:benzoylformate decarboxylase
VGTFVEAGVRLAVVTEDPDEANRSPVDLAVLAQHP